MKFIFLILPFFCTAKSIDTTIAISLPSQSVDTLSHALSYRNTQMNFSTVPYGLTTNNHIYTVAWINHYEADGVTARPLELVRIDLTAGTQTSKILTGTVSNTSALWVWTMDSLGNIYTGLNSNNRTTLKLNLKDSIYYEIIGQLPGSQLAYSMSLGRDKNMYFGSSGATNIASYNPYTHTYTNYPGELDTHHNYVLAVLGDDDNYVYVETGQTDSIELWAYNKIDFSKSLLFKVANNTRFQFEVRNTGIYTWGGQWGTYYLRNGIATQIGAGYSQGMPVGSYRIAYAEVNADGGNLTAGSFYDDATNTLGYRTSRGDTGHIAIAAETLPDVSRFLFTDATDTNTVYYVSNYYGTFYKYNLLTNISTALGSAPFNIYSAIQVNDSVIELGGYPSGVINRFHTNQTTHTWNVNKWNAQYGYVPIGTDLGDNPRIEGYGHTNSEISHVFQMLKDAVGNVVFAGDVIRTSSGVGFGAARITGNNVTAVVGVPAKDSMGFAGMALWRNYVLISTNNYYGSHSPKIYVYSSASNTIVDSIDNGFLDNGAIYTVGDKLVGVANNKIYNYNLAAKVLINSHTYSANAITWSYQMPDGRILIKQSGVTLPTDMSFTFVNYIGSITGNMITSGSKLFILSADGKYVIRLNNYFYNDQNLTTPAGVFAMIQRKLNLKQ